MINTYNFLMLNGFKVIREIKSNLFGDNCLVLSNNIIELRFIKDKRMQYIDIRSIIFAKGFFKGRLIKSIMYKIVFFKQKQHSIFTLFMLFCLVLLFGCEGYKCAIGTIYDSTTNQTIDSVKCVVLTGTETQFSDSIGKYSVCNDFGGCVPKCLDIQIEFSKTGYKTKIVINPNNIYLEKE
ncbi:hypothetical protein [Viscerimonas tarda]